MAKISAHGSEKARLTVDGRLRFRVMADGTVLRQLHIDGRWERPTVYGRARTGAGPALQSMRARYPDAPVETF